MALLTMSILLCIQFDSEYLEKKLRHVPPWMNFLSLSASSSSPMPSMSAVNSPAARTGSVHSPISI